MNSQVLDKEVMVKLGDTDAMNDFIKDKGYEVVQKYEDEGWSGDSLERPQLDQLRLDAQKKLWDAVLFYDPDRLARRYYYQELVMDELRMLGIEPLFVTMPPSKNNEDRLMMGVRGVFAEYERKKIAERCRIGKLRKAKEGHIITSEAPYGLTFILRTKEREGFYEINPKEIDTLRLIFNLADNGYTIRRIVKELQELGIPPRKSKRGVWNTSTLITLLRNRSYIGESHFGASYAVEPVNPIKKEKYKKIKKTSRKFHPEDKWIQIPTIKVIDKELFDRVQEKLKINKLHSDRCMKYEYLFSKKVHCTCGCTRSGAGPQKGKDLYYRCNDRIYKFPLPPICEEGSINARVADRLAWEELEKILTSQEEMQRQIERWKEERPSRVKRVSINTEALKKELNKLVKEEDRYTKLFGEGLLDIIKYKKFVDPIRERVSSINEQISKSKQDMQTPDEILFPDDEQLKALARDSKIKIANGLNFEEKKGIVKNIVDSMVGNKEIIHVFGFIPVPESYNILSVSVDTPVSSPYLLDNINFCAEYRNCRTSKRRKIDAF